MTIFIGITCGLVSAIFIDNPIIMLPVAMISSVALAAIYLSVTGQFKKEKEQ